MFSTIINTLKQNDATEKDHVSNFVFKCTLDPTDFQIEINGFGRIPFPISQDPIQKLLKIAHLAKFGLREKTIEDTNTRNTYEITANQIQIRGQDTAMANLLNEMRESFGLSEQCQLTAHLHNLLIYGPGQFFKRHQDSEKLDNMVATLVLVLPSPHIGGDLIIEHQHKTHRFVSENLNHSAIQCFSFYADCQHEIDPVKQGYRVALTYNIVLQAKEKLRRLENRFKNAPLQRALEKYFQISKPASSDPLMLTYFLDHQYSERGLKWETLKGTDSQHAMAFRHAAKQLNLIPHLALVEIHESWTAEEGYGDDDPEPHDLITDDTTLSYWLDKNGKKLSYKNFILSEDKICYSINTKELEPNETEYEGWMGNYGNTVDYWYRRAAIVLWREKDHVAMAFQLNYNVAFKQLMKLTRRPGHEKEARDIIKKAGEYIYESTSHVNPDSFEDFITLAAYIQDKALTDTILKPFCLAMLTINGISGLFSLQTQYGINWCLTLIKKWAEPKDRYWHHIDPIKNIDTLVAHAEKIKLDPQLTTFFLNYQLQFMLNEDKHSTAYSSPFSLQEEALERNRASIDWLKAAFLSHDTHSMITTWISHLLSNTEHYSILDLSYIYFSLREDIPSCYEAPLNVLKTHVSGSLHEELQKGSPDPDDWSIHVKLRCRCEHCKVAMSFLRSPTTSKKVWPIIQEHRDHISNQLNGLELPVDISVEKKGRPYQLVLKKTTALYQYSKKRFDSLVNYAKKLEA